MSVIAYIIDQGGQRFLCVIDDAKEPGFWRFPLDTMGLARLAAESARAVNSSIGGYDTPAKP